MSLCMHPNKFPSAAPKDAHKNERTLRHETTSSLKLSVTSFKQRTLRPPLCRSQSERNDASPNLGELCTVVCLRFTVT